MPATLKDFLQRWAISTIAVLVATYIVPRIRYEHALDLVVATFILGLLNTFVRPLLMLLSLPLLVVSLGLFTLVINALLLYSVSLLLQPRFVVESFGAAFWGGLVISIVTLALNVLTGAGNTRVEYRRMNPDSSGTRRRRPKKVGGPRGDDDGPVIDV